MGSQKTDVTRLFFALMQMNQKSSPDGSRSEQSSLPDQSTERRETGFQTASAFVDRYTGRSFSLPHFTNRARSRSNLSKVIDQLDEDFVK